MKLSTSFTLQTLSLLGLAVSAAASSQELQCHDESFVPDHVLRITRANISIGCEKKLAFVANNTLPGPPIRLQPGKVSWIRVYNDVPDANLTMHWHGLSQRMAPFADGTPQASQWPIPPLHYFDYEVAPGKLDAGTYFYHSHVGFQASTCMGALIVEDEGPPPYKYDEERVIVVSDYFNKTDEAIVTGLEGSPFKWSGETNAVLLNGMGVSNNLTNPASCPLPAFNMKPDKHYRFRFVGATALSYVSLKLEGHEMTVIAADGHYTQPHTIDHLQIASGQRFDVLIKSKSRRELEQAKRHAFYMKFQTRERPANYTGYAVFGYDHDTPPTKIPESATKLEIPTNTSGWLEYALQPLKQNGFPLAHEVTRRVEIVVNQAGTAKGSIRWYQNYLNWTERSEPRPLLPDIYAYGQAAIPDYPRALQNGGWDPVFKAWPALIGEVLEIVLVNTGSTVDGNGGLDYHPFHAHSGHFWDIGTGCGVYNSTENENRLHGYSPVLRDTTLLNRCATKTKAGSPDSWRAWRVRVSNPGVYMIHCHILQHMIMGMQMMWVYGNADEIQKIPLGAATGYLTYGGSVMGNASQPAELYHYFRDKSQMPWM